MNSLTFNGVRKPRIHLLKGRTKPPFPSIERGLLTIPGRDGALLKTSKKQPLIINQPIGFVVTDDNDALQLKDQLAEWLVTEEPASLVFDDEPGRTYYALVQNTIEDFEKFATLRSGTIQFLCPDPYSYGEEITQDLSTNSLITNNGTAETFPIFDIDVPQSITRLEIKNKSLVDRQGASPSIVLGRAASMEQTEYVREELIFNDTMQSTTSWQAATEVDNGYIAGEMGADASGFYPSLVGDAIKPYDWQGPSLIKGIGASLQDFKADILVESMNMGFGFEIGMFDVYLRDANSNVIGKVSFGDAWQDKTENFGKGQVGDYFTGKKLGVWAAYPAGWNNFDGILRIERIDNVWRFYYAQIALDGSHNWVGSNTRFTDNANQYMAPVTDVQVAFRSWPGTVRTDMRIKEIKLYRINPPASGNDSVPYIATVGDKLTIDSKKSLIAKNGEPRTDLVLLETQMFPLKTGLNQLEVSPGVKVTAKYRKAWL